jgi:hypothetical protein
MNQIFKKRAAPDPHLAAPYNTPALSICNDLVCAGKLHALNTVPAAGPNADTIYGAGWLDLLGPVAITLPAAEAADPHRYINILGMDVYGNVVFVMHRSDYPHVAPQPGYKFCVYNNPAHAATCNSAAFNGGFHSTQRHVFVITRVYSSGDTVPSCVDPVSAVPPSPHLVFRPGPDGCNMLEGINAAPVVAGTPAIDPWNVYHALMDPVNPNACGYSFQQPPCHGQNKNAFWNAVCMLIKESPPNADEGAYIDRKFTAFGIHSHGCDTHADGTYNLDYYSLTKYQDDVWNALVPAESTVGVNDWQHSNQWVMIPFTGQWVASEKNFADRANVAPNVPNSDSVYWLGFWDSRPDGQKTDLSLEGGTRYRIQFSPDQPIPIDFAKGGFWSFTIYNPSWYFMTHADKSPRSYRIHSRDSGVSADGVFTPPADIYIQANCTGTDNCLEAPATGEFRVVMRGYTSLPSFREGYPLPRIKKCGGAKNLGC